VRTTPHKALLDPVKAKSPGSAGEFDWGGAATTSFFLGPRERITAGRVVAVKAYGSRASPAYLRRRGIRCTIPDKTDHVRHRKNKARAGGRPPAFDPDIYKQRHAVERGMARRSRARSGVDLVISTS